MNSKILTKNLEKTFFSKRKKEKDVIDKGTNSTYLILIGFISALLFYYVWTVNVNANKGHQIRNLEIEKKLLKEELNLLDVKIAEIKSLYSIEKNNGDLKYMEEAENPTYLVIKEGVEYVYNN